MALLGCCIAASAENSVKAFAWVIFLLSVVCFGIGMRAQQLESQCQEYATRPAEPTEEWERSPGRADSTNCGFQAPTQMDAANLADTIHPAE